MTLPMFDAPFSQQFEDENGDSWTLQSVLGIFLRKIRLGSGVSLLWIFPAQPPNCLCQYRSKKKEEETKNPKPQMF